MSEENGREVDERTGTKEDPHYHKEITFSVFNAKVMGLNESLIYPYISKQILWAGPGGLNHYCSKYARGRWWTEIWLEIMHDRVPFFSEDTLVKAIRSLEKQSYILTHNTEPGRDYTKRWYAFHPSHEKWMRQTGMEVPGPPERDNPGYVYLLSGNGQYKIGKSKDVDHRVAQIGLKLPFSIEIVDYMECSDMTATEAEWHARFADKRVNGEWFDLTKEDVRAFHSAVAEVERKTLLREKEAADE